MSLSAYFDPWCKMLKVHNFSVQHGGLRRTFQTSRKRQVTRSNLTCKSRKKVETSSHLVPRVFKVDASSPVARVTAKKYNKWTITSCVRKNKNSSLWRRQIMKNRPNLWEERNIPELWLSSWSSSCKTRTAKLTHVYKTATIQRSFETFCKLGSKITCKKQALTPHIK